MTARLIAAAAALLPAPAFAEAIAGGAKQPLNLTAIAIFLAFVVATLGITKWAAAMTRSASDFLTAGGGISGFQNGLAVWKTVLGHDAAIFPWDNPALFSMPAAFLVAWAVSRLDRSPEARAEAAAFNEQYVRAQTGLGAAAAAAH